MHLYYPQTTSIAPQLLSMKPVPGAIKTGDCCLEGGIEIRLLCLWDSLGKDTGVGCHFLLQCMEVKSESKVTQWSPTLSNPMDCSPPGSSVHGIFQARVLEWGAIS